MGTAAHPETYVLGMCFPPKTDMLLGNGWAAGDFSGRDNSEESLVSVENIGGEL